MSWCVYPNPLQVYCKAVAFMFGLLSPSIPVWVILLLSSSQFGLSLSVCLFYKTAATRSLLLLFPALLYHCILYVKGSTSCYKTINREVFTEIQEHISYGYILKLHYHFANSFVVNIAVRCLLFYRLLVCITLVSCSASCFLYLLL